MSVIVQKFGGTSLADPARIQRCAARAVAARRAGHQVVVVVSAMGHTTDRLLDLAGALSRQPNRRELDLLLTTGEQTSAALMSMAIHSAGVDAISFSGHRLGIITDPVHCRARIRSIDRQRIAEQLEFGRIVVAAGFQGITEDGQVTTLGRGGSDLTAVALAAALGVNESSGSCEIYTDVDGVLTADPRIVPDARKLGRIAYEEMLELASLGASVLHCRAAICAQKYGVPLHIRHSAREGKGTFIMSTPLDTSSLESVAVVGCALTRDLVMISLRGLPNPRKPRQGSAAQAIIFQKIAEAGVFIDDIVQTEVDQRADISFTSPRDDLDALQDAVRLALAEIGEGEMAVRSGLAKVSAVGVGMRTHTGVAATMFAALAEAGIGIRTITTSEIKISCIVDEALGEEALRRVHGAFGLGQPAAQPAPAENAGAVQIEVKSSAARSAVQ